MLSARPLARPIALPLPLLTMLLIGLLLPQVGAPAAPWPAPQPPRDAAPRAEALPAGIWGTGPRMFDGRSRHTATLLADGNVLVIGGVGNAGLEGTEIYDPLASRWRQVANPTVTRQRHSSTRLDDGRVLVVGGYYGIITVTSAELFDPATESWSTAGSLATGRAQHTATLLPDGRVFVVGGSDMAETPLASAEIFDPSTNTWQAAASMGAPRRAHTATLLADGRVLVVGGSDVSGASLASAEIYSPASNTWSSAAPLATARQEHTATLLADGRVLVAAGYDGSQITSAERYNPATNSWSSAGSLAAARDEHTATLMPDGSVVVIAGYRAGSGALTSVERYDPAANSWSSAGTLADQRYRHTATLLASGQILVAGGEGNGNASTSSAELYDLGAQGVSGAGALASARQNHTATLLADGRVLVVGGDAGGSPFASAELYDPATNSWSSAAALAGPRRNHTATLLPDGRVLVVGGDSGGAAVNTAELYDPVSNSWGSAVPLAGPRRQHTATLLADGRVLVAGGEGPLASAEVYDSSSNSWSIAGNLTQPRRDHVATRLADGRVLVTAGYGFGSLASAELYNPVTNTWTSLASMATPRNGHTATLLPDERVLVAGGRSFGSLTSTSAERFQPSANVWSATPALAAARTDHTATLLPDGDILILGGFNDIQALSSAERYNPFQNSWASAGGLLTGRHGHTATLLRDGRILSAGGAGGGGALASAERYDPRPAAIRSVILAQPVSAPAPPLPRSVYQVSPDATLTAAGRHLELAGTGFREPALGGFPILRLQNLDTGLIHYVPGDFTRPWSATAFATQPLPADFPPGYALASVVVNGIASAARMVYVNGPPRIAPIGDQQVPVRRAIADPPLELTIAVADAETPVGELRVSARAADDALAPRVAVLPGPTPGTRTLRIATPLEAWGQTRVTVRVDDGLNIAERSFGLQVIRAAPPWLVLLYLAGDDIPSALTASTDDGGTPGETLRGVRADSLTTHLDRLIERLADEATLPFNEAMRLVVLYDGAAAGDSKIYVREEGAAGGGGGLIDVTCLPRPGGGCALSPTPPWETYPASRELDTGSAATLGNFVDWARRQYPGSPYTMLAIVDHGGGWSPDGGSTNQPRNSRVWQLGAWRGLNLDYSSNSALSTKELSRALAGRAPFDVLFVDACLMGMAEVAHELAVTPSGVAGRPIASYLVAGENLLWARLPYEEYLRPDVLTATTTPRQLAEQIVRRYNLVDPATPDTPDPVIPGRFSVNASAEPFAIAAIDLRTAAELTPRVEQLAQGLLATIPPEPDDLDDPARLAAYQATLAALPITGAITQAHRLAQKFDYDLSLSLGPNDGYVDLADFADQLSAQPAVSAPLRQLAGEISTAIKGEVVVQSRYRSGQIVLPTGIRTWDFGRAYGLAIYAPLGEQDCRTTGPILDAIPTPAEESQGAFRCALPRADQQYVTVPGALGTLSQHILVERQLGYYRDPQQLAFSAAAPSWAELMSRLDRLAVPRDPDPSDPAGRPYNPVNQPELGQIFTRDLANGGCLLIEELDFDLEQCLPPGAVPPFTRLTHTDILTSSVAFGPGDTPLYVWRLTATGEGGTRVPAPVSAGTIAFTFTQDLIDEPEIDFERLQVLGWDGRRWLTLPATSFDRDLRAITVPLARFNRYALVSRIGGDGLDNLTAESIDLVANPPLPRAGSPVSLTLTVHRPGGKDALEDVRVRFEYQLPGEPRRLIGEQTVPLLSPRGEADTLPLAWEPSAAGSTTLFATIDPGLEILGDDKGDNVISRTLAVDPPLADVAAPRVAAFSIAGGAPQTTVPLVALSLDGEDPAPSSGITAMRFIEYRYSAATARWEYAQDSGWIPYEQAYAWTLRGDPGVKYMHAWVRDGAGNISPYPYRAMTSLLAGAAALGEGGVHVYRFALRAGECLAASLTSQGDADLALWGTSEDGARLLASSMGRDGADALVTHTDETGTYQLEVAGFSAATYDLEVQILSAGAPGCEGQDSLDAAGASPGKAPPSAPSVPLASMPDEALPAEVWSGPLYLPQITR